MPPEKIIQQGAEAKILLMDNQIVKDRIPKSYRLKELDEKIRSRRTRSEAKLLEKATKVIFTPRVIEVDEKNSKIIMEFVKGKRLSDYLNNFSLSKQLGTMREIGMLTGILHANDIIHGDLTTSNMILNEETGRVFFIDFGLSFISKKIEDKAVDLHLIIEALEAKHYKNHDKLRRAFFQGYKSWNKKYQKVFERLKAVEKRGRYKR